MNRYLMMGKWNVLRGKLKQKYADLTDDDLKYVEGKENELFGRLSEKLGKPQHEIEEKQQILSEKKSSGG